MATNQKVNVKFVVGLAVGLTVLFGAVAYLGFQALTRSGAEYFELGEKLSAEGKYNDASKAYASAVAHERTNVEWLSRWRDTIPKTIPPTEVEYSQAYQHYYQILEILASIRDSEPQAQREYLDAIYQQAKLFGFNVQSWQHIAERASERIERLEQSGVDSSEVQSLRRYRGLALLRQMETLPDRGDLRDSAIKDLKAAVAANPDDAEAALGIVRWNTIEWLRLRRERREEKAAEAMAEIEKTLASLLARHPGDPEALLNEIAVKIDHAVQGMETAQERMDALKTLEGQEERLIEAVKNTDPSKFQVTLLPRVGQVLTLLRQRDVADLMVDLCDTLLRGRPDDPYLLRLRATALADLGRSKEAIDTLERIVQAPDLPVSLSGVILKNLRQEALYQQGMNWLALRDRSSDAAERAAALKSAKDLREALVQRASGGAESPLTLMLDANIGLSDGRPEIAVERLTRLDAQTSDESATKPQILNMLAQALGRQGQLGAAKDRYEKLVKVQPYNLGAVIQILRIDMELRDYNAVEKRLEKALRDAPDNPELKTIALALNAARGDVASITDPVVVALVEAENETKKSPPDVPKARTIIAELMESHPEDARVHGAMVAVELVAGDYDAAEAWVDKAIVKFPNSPLFRDYKARLSIRSAENRPEAISKMIDGSQLSPVDKLLRKHMVYRSAGLNAEADRFLAEAAAIEPENAGVVEQQFIHALESKDYDRARQLTTVASRINADQAAGLTFQARIELQRNELDAAMATLQRASDRLPFHATIWRLLGQVQLSKGQVEQAIQSLAKAYLYQPQDLQTALVYLSALVQVQRDAEALVIAQSARRIFPSNPQIMEAWLSLEASAGDKELAIAERSSRRAANPKDVGNTLALVRLLLDKKDWSQARALLDEIKAQGGDAFANALLEARWHALQSEEGVDKGREVIVEAIGAIPADKLDARPHLALAEYLLEFNRKGEAIAAFEQAAKHQDPKTMEADRARAENFFASGQYAESLDPYKKLIAAGVKDANDPSLYILRRVEALTYLERWAEADAELKSLGDGAKEVRILMLGSQVAKGLGDMRRARELLNQAVALAPSDPRPFLQRALLNAPESDRIQDVMRDLDQAIRLQPSLVVARRLRAQVFKETGRIDDMITELKNAVQANPASDELRMILVGELIALQRREDAQSAAQQAVRDRPRHPFWLKQAGSVYANSAEAARRAGESPGRVAELYNIAADYFKQATDITEDPTTLYLLANAYLSTAPAKPQEALAAIGRLGDIVNKDALLLIMKARALMVNRQEREAKATAAVALSLCSSSNEVREWMGQTQKMFPSASDVANFLAQLTPPESVRPAYMVGLSRMQLSRAEMHQELLARLTDLAGQTTEKEVLSEIYSIRGTIEYSLKMYEAAAKSFEAGAASDPNNLDFNNNLAFTRAKHLNDVQGALKPALRAVELAPQNPIALDTLGWVYLKLGGHASQAEATLNKAMLIARPAYQTAVDNAGKDAAALQLAPVLIHMGQLQVAKGDKGAAARLAQEAQALLESHKLLGQEYQSDLDVLLEQTK